MPELPEVETVRRGLAVRMEGRRISRVDQYRPDLRFAMPERLPQRLVGRRVLAMGRRGKYLLANLDDGQVLVLHLGMSGRLLLRQQRLADYRVGTHDHLIIEVEDGGEDGSGSKDTWIVVFNDARRFGQVDLVPADALEQCRGIAALGPEPLDPSFTGAVLGAALAGRRTPIKAALLDQQIVAGIGNIYACESLFRAGISPRRSAATVVGARAERLAGAIRGVLTEAIAAGGSSLRDYVQTDGELGYFQHAWAVYDKEGQPCPGCSCGSDSAGLGGPGGPGIRRIVQGGRSTFYCPWRQR